MGVILLALPYPWYFHTHYLCHPERSATTSWPSRKYLARSRRIPKVYIPPCCRREFSPCSVPLRVWVLSCCVRNGKRLLVWAVNAHVRRVLHTCNVRRWRSRENSLTRYGK